MDMQIVATEIELEVWKKQIEDAWQRTVASVIEVGNLVKQAKEKLGVSYNLLETELPFSSTVAAFLVKIVEHPVLSNPAYFSKLPNSYNTLYHLASIEEAELIEQIDKGEITPNFTLTSAKTLKSTSKGKAAQQNNNTERTSFDVGKLEIPIPRNLNDFQADLNVLLEKYNGTLSITQREGSLCEWNRQQMHKRSLEKIEKFEAEMTTVSLEEIRMLEDAAHYLQKDKNQKHKREVMINDKLVMRTCLPDSYNDTAALQKLTGKDVLSRGALKHWCIENKVLNKFTELKSMDKELYIWEQVRLITEKKDRKGGLKRLKDLATRSTIPMIKKLAQKSLDDVTRFDKKK